MEIPNDDITPDDIQPGADLSGADLSDADLTGADLSGAYLLDANLSDANLSNVSLKDAIAQGADFTGAHLIEADLTNADLRRAQLANADLWLANLEGTTAALANFTDAILVSVGFEDTNLEETIFSRANLIRSDLSSARYYGAVFTDAQIDHTTTFGKYCIYDPKSADALSASDVYDPKSPSAYSDGRESSDPPASAFEMEKNRLNKAASVYQNIEKLARENALPDLQRRMFVRGRDIHRCRYRHEALGGRNWRNRAKMAFDFGFTTLSRSVFLYGESLLRIAMWSGIVIGSFSIVYAGFPVGGLSEVDTQVSDLETVDSILFSAQVFTSGGASEVFPDNPSLRLLVTVESILGGLLFALFVFVLGRRAAR